MNLDLEEGAGFSPLSPCQEGGPVAAGANSLASVVKVSTHIGTVAGRSCDAGKWDRCPAVHRFVNAWRLANGVAK